MHSQSLNFKISVAVFICLGVAAATASAQPPQSQFESPIVNADRTVTFSFRAPDAREVKLNGQFASDNQVMKRDERGIWTITLGPIEPNLYPYCFIVDGVSVADPNNLQQFPNERFKNSLVDVPNDPPSPYAVQDVPHGKVDYLTYRSKTLNSDRPLLVYTPPGYALSDHRYPVLYLVSGTTDTEETWFKVGRVNFILDNLIAAKQVRPTIVVMPYGNMLMGAPGPSTPEVGAMYQRFSDELMHDILPLVESQYLIDTRRENRAIAGFSRGGGQSLYTGFANLEHFSAIGSFAAYLTPDLFKAKFGSLIDPSTQTNERLRLLWMGVGTEDFLFKPATEFEKFLSDHGIKHKSIVTGGGHTWMNARSYLIEMLLKLYPAEPTKAEAARFEPISITIENGGTGLYPAIASEEADLPGITIFRPRDLTPFHGNNRMPVLLWGNGACANTAEEHKNFLNEIASHGYVIFAIGPLNQLTERGPAAGEKTSSDQLRQSLDWIESQVRLGEEGLAAAVDITRVAAMGMSCGGLQALAVSDDPRIDTTVICNSGVLPTPSPMRAMPPLTKDDLKKLHAPVIYIMGGPSDIAYKNAMDDFSRIEHVPVAMANHDVGHGGTYRQPHGGEFTKVALGWLDWQLKGDQTQSTLFFGADAKLKSDPKWQLETKNFK